MYRNYESAKDECVFSILGRCDTGTGAYDFGCICRKHMRDVTLMDVSTDFLVSAVTTKKAMKQVFVENRGVVLPFPYKMEGRDENAVWCIDPALLESSVNKFVNKLNVAEKMIPDVIAIYQGLFSNGYVMYNQYVGSQLGAFQNFLSNGKEQQIKQRWSDSKLYVIYTDEQGATRTFLYPMAKMPVIYQILFAYTEMSTNRSSSAANPETVTLQPNVALDLNQNAFVVINENELNPVYLKKGESTWSSPIVIAGVTVTPAKIELFSKYAFSARPVFQNLPNYCKPT